MGFDLYGSKKGVFSANVHDFRNLWHFVCDLCDFDEEQRDRGTFNDFNEFNTYEAFYIEHVLKNYIFYYGNVHISPTVNLKMFYLFVKDSGGFVIESEN
jgi:hypothetical protein